MVIERLTNQKKAILDFLRATPGHPDAYEIFTEVKQRLPQISLATVYRNLDSMNKKGLIHAIRIKDDRFNYDGVEASHHHFLCSECNRLYNVSEDLLLNFEKVNESGIVGFVSEYQVMMKGVCVNCKRLKDKKK
jgi:Fe2+ or Zn2+ uptake regulation protein